MITSEEFKSKSLTFSIFIQNWSVTLRFGVSRLKSPRTQTIILILIKSNRKMIRKNPSKFMNRKNRLWLYSSMMKKLKTLLTLLKIVSNNLTKSVTCMLISKIGKSSAESQTYNLSNSSAKDLTNLHKSSLLRWWTEQVWKSKAQYLVSTQKKCRPNFNWTAYIKSQEDKSVNKTTKQTRDQSFLVSTLTSTLTHSLS